MKTIVVNFFAGPSAGKTTCAWEIASELKKRSIVTEYVSEYAKELVWDKRFDLLDGSIKHQRMILNEQNRRLARYEGKVDVVVTDAPLLSNLIYLKEENPYYIEGVLDQFNQYNNFNLFIKRGKMFEPQGRMHDLKESVMIDKKIIEMLEYHKIFYGTYYHKTTGVIVENIIRNLQTRKNTAPNPERENYFKKLLRQDQNKADEFVNKVREFDIGEANSLESIVSNVVNKIPGTNEEKSLHKCL